MNQLGTGINYVNIYVIFSSINSANLKNVSKPQSDYSSCSQEVIQLTIENTKHNFDQIWKPSKQNPKDHKSDMAADLKLSMLRAFWKQMLTTNFKIAVCKSRLIQYHIHGKTQRTDKAQCQKHDKHMHGPDRAHPISERADTACHFPSPNLNSRCGLNLSYLCFPWKCSQEWVHVDDCSSFLQCFCSPTPTAAPRFLTLLTLS